MVEAHSAATLAAPSRTLPERSEVVPLERGAPLGRYVVLDRQGAGGMGEVYGAYDPELDRKVAVKLLLADRSGEGTEGHTRLQREAQAMARLSHPNVITVHDVGMLDDRVFVAMEFVEGYTLTEWLAERDRDWRDVIEVFVSAGLGLAAAHEKSLVHRDFKPDNVMIGDDGRVRVMDFGLARSEGSDKDETEQARPRVDSFSVELTGAGSMMGTPAYMAPEQFLGEATDARSDQFSFCVSLYEALYGERPFEADSLAALSFAVTSGEVNEPPAGTSVPGWLRKVVLRGLCVDPEERWPSMDALLDALRANPERARRRWLLAAGGVVFVGAGIGGDALLDQRARAQCEAEADTIDGTWNDGVRERLLTTFRDNGGAYATEAAPRVTLLLDAYADAWRSAQTSVCIDALERAEASDPALLCLVERRDALEGLLEVLSSATRGVVESSVPAVSKLPRIDQCLDARWLDGHPMPPAEERERVHTLEKKLHIATSLFVTGRLDEAATLLDELLATADSLQWDRLPIRLRLQKANVLHEQGRREESAALFREAFFAASGSGYDGLVARAAVSLGNSRGSEGSDVEGGWFWAHMADAAMKRGGENESRRISWLHLTADLLVRDGKWDEAKARYDEALELGNEFFGPRHFRIASLLNNLAILHSDRGDYETARQVSRRALEIRIETLGEHHPDTADGVNNLASLERRAGDLEEARRLFERALLLWREAFDEDHERIAYGLSNLGDVELELDHNAEAEELFSQAIAILEKFPEHDERNLANAVDNLGTAYMRQARYLEAEQAFDRALSIRGRTAGEGHPEYATSLNNLANVKRYAGDLEAAAQLYEQALAIQLESLGERHPYVAITKMNLGDVQLLRQQAELALPAFETALAIAEATFGNEHPVTANALSGLGRAQLALGRSDDARRSLERALAIADGMELPAEIDGGIRFAVARMLTGSDATAGSRAIRLAKRAEAALRDAGPTVTAEREAVTRWLAEALP